MVDFVPKQHLVVLLYEERGLVVSTGCVSRNTKARTIEEDSIEDDRQCLFWEVDMGSCV